MGSRSMFGYDKDEDEKDDSMWFDDVDGEEINVDEEFKSAEEYVEEYDDGL